ncbi:secreted RxLR effector protein 161-like [Arachis hypogaea]|uniref:secreted RxLR effector protein 161-like n=1 Tax=Arachis hypogaea TaxID=3818 RepID=UPI003B225565
MVSSLQLLFSGVEAFEDLKLFRTMIGSLQYLTITRPNFSFAVNKISQFMHAPLLPHWKATKRILRYLQGTKKLGLAFHKCSDTRFYAFFDSDWAANIEDRRSVFGFCVYFGTNLVSWSCRKQSTISRSSTKAEFRSLASCEAELVWLQNLFHELDVSLLTPPTIHCDNLSTVLRMHNPILQDKTKHFQLEIRLIRDKLRNNSLHIVHIPGAEQIADIFTKPLSATSFERLRIKLRVTL